VILQTTCDDVVSKCIEVRNEPSTAIGEGGPIGAHQNRVSLQTSSRLGVLRSGAAMPVIGGMSDTKVLGGAHENDDESDDN
jgi:hypothetical protein